MRFARNVTAAVADYDHDGDEDLYVLGNTWPTYDYRPDDLYQNRGNGEFTAVPGQPWSLDLDNSVDCGWADYDRDGLLDMYVADANLAARECLYRQRTEGSFVTMTAAQVGSIVTVHLGAYASAWSDYDNDGDPDLWVSSGDGHCRLHQNDGRGYFSAATNAGTITTVPANGIGVWGDYDNDGWLDLFVANFENGTNLFYRNLGNATFEKLDVGSPIRDGNLRATVAWVDYDNDGFLDLFITCGNGTALPNHLYRNNLPAIGNANYWLKIKLDGQAANRSGIGAKIRVKATIGGQEIRQVREISGNSGYQGGYGLVAHFGLGDATQADLVRVEWPSGNVQELTNVTAGQAGQALLTITEQVRITPVRPSASLGGPVTLTAQLNGTWQWYHDGEAMEGQTAKTLNLSATTPEHAGRYSVVVTTATGTVTNHVYLLVDIQFERIPMGSTAPSWGCAWGDYNNDGYLDLFVTDGSQTSTPLAVLWRNLGNGQFVEATEAGPFTSDWLWTVPMWGDFDRDGHLDLFVANAWYDPPTWDVSNVLYRSFGNGTFRKEADDEIVRFRGQLQGGSAGDMDGDGDLDILLTGQDGATLFEKDGAAGFHQVGFPTVSGLCITPSWADYDNDGRLDVFVAVYDWTHQFSHQLVHNDGNGQWTPIPLGASLETSAGMWADYDNDGDLDLFVTGHAGTSEVLYRNHGNANHWISFKLVGTRSNRSAIGAKVRVQATIFGKTYWQLREIGGGNRHQNDMRPHFGLGDAPRAATVRVEWPSGAIEEFANLARDQFHTIVEPSLRGALKPNGEVELRVTATLNRIRTIEHSSDLATWTLLTTVTGAGETPITVTDPGAPGKDQRFYRMK